MDHRMTLSLVRSSRKMATRRRWYVQKSRKLKALPQNSTRGSEGGGMVNLGSSVAAVESWR
jgi:hypothetical protein